jgi:hypothetical protein
VQPPASVVSVTADGEALEQTGNSFALPEHDRSEGDAIEVVVTYGGGSTSTFTIVVGERCNEYCTFSDCAGNGSLLVETVDYFISASALDYECYACEWQHSNVQACP